MADKQQKLPSSDEFFKGLRDSLTKTATQQARPSERIATPDEADFQYFKTPAPNIIEWTTRAEYLNIPRTFEFWRQYQVLRDLFQLRCPLSTCNDQSPEAKDCWGKSRQYLESENLLVYNDRHKDDACPRCGTTRMELVSDGLMKIYNQCHGVVGMRCKVDGYLTTNTGIKRLSDLLPSDPTPDTFYPINGVMVLGQNGWESASDVYYAGVAKTKVAKLALGIETCGSYVHPVYGYSSGTWGWHKLPNLQPGDWVEARVASWPGHDVAIDKSVIVGAFNATSKWAHKDRITLPEQWSDSLASVLGYLTAEGDVNSEIGVIGFTNGDLTTKLHYIQCIEDTFGVDVRAANHDDEFGLRFCSKLVRAYLVGLGLDYTLAATKKVPKYLWSANKQYVAAFLRAYFEGDGTAAIEIKPTTAKAKRKPTVACYSVSKTLAKEIQLMLWHFGITASLTKTKSREFGTGGKPFDHDAYSVRIYGTDIIKYRDEIGFNSARKRAALDACCVSVMSSKTRDDFIPGVRDAICTIYSKLGKLNTRAHTITTGVRSGKYATLSRGMLLEFLSICGRDGVEDEYDLLLSLTAPNARYLEVLSLEDGPDERLYDLYVPGTHSFMADLVLNHNSGKTATAGIVGTYAEHRLINVGLEYDLGEFFEQLKSQRFEVTFIASTDVQSSDTVWAYFTSMRSNGPWHQRYIKWIKTQEAKQDTANGMKPWQYLETNKVIEHGNLNLLFKSLNSNSGGMAGRTRPAAFMDEVARFDNGQSARSADEAYRVLENSLRTLRSKAIASAKKHQQLIRDGITPTKPLLPWVGLMVSISSPISAEDKAMRLLKVAPEVPNMYYFHYPTWEFNPFEPYENFAGDFAKDHDGAMRDFGANPPAAANPLISDPKQFRDMAIDKVLRPTAYFIPYVHMDRTGVEYMGLRFNSAVMLRDYERYICFDAGQSFDQFAGACAHGEWVETKDGRQLVTVFDWVIRILPSQIPKREVWFDSIMQMIEELKKFQRVAMVDFDRWQSTYLIQQIRDVGIPAQMSGTKAEDFVKLVADVKFSRVRMLPPVSGEDTISPQNMSAETVQYYELERLERSSDLKKVFNPNKGKARGVNSDDVAQVVAHCNRMVQNTVVDLSDSNSQEQRLHREQVSGMGWGNRGTLYRAKHNIRGW